MAISSRAIWLLRIQVALALGDNRITASRMVASDITVHFLASRIVGYDGIGGGGGSVL